MPVLRYDRDDYVHCCVWFRKAETAKQWFTGDDKLLLVDTNRVG